MPKIRLSSQKFRCLFCGSGFLDMHSLQEHVRNCKQGREPNAQDKEKVMCEYCPRLFGRMADLRRHIRRMHGMVTETVTTSGLTVTTPELTVTTSNLPVTTRSVIDLGLDVSSDELGSDPDISFEDDTSVSTKSETVAATGDHPMIQDPPILQIPPVMRKPTKPALITSGKKTTSLSFGIGQKIVARGVSTTASVRTPIVATEPQEITLCTSASDMRRVIVPSSTKTSETASSTSRDYGVQCTLERSRVEHHRLIETVKVFKENGADVTRKEVHETRWVE